MDDVAAVLRAVDDLSRLLAVAEVAEGDARFHSKGLERIRGGDVGDEAHADEAVVKGIGLCFTIRSDDECIIMDFLERRLQVDVDGVFAENPRTDQDIAPG